MSTRTGGLIRPVMVVTHLSSSTLVSKTRKRLTIPSVICPLEVQKLTTVPTNQLIGWQLPCQGTNTTFRGMLQWICSSCSYKSLWLSSAQKQKGMAGAEF